MTPMRHGGCWAGVGARRIYTRRSRQALRHGPTDVARLGYSLQYRRRCWVVRSHLSRPSQKWGWYRLEGEKIVSLARSVPAPQGAVRLLIDRITGIEDSSR